MIWWRGKGLWIGLIACLPAFAAGRLGATQLALAYAVSAVVIYLARDGLGAESALFSIPTRLWPPLLLIVALVAFFSGPKTVAPPADGRKAAEDALKASLPRTLNGQIRIERIDKADAAGRKLQYHATSLAEFDGTQASFERQAREHYCGESKALWEAGIGIDFQLTVTPKSLSDRVTSHSIALAPQDCGAARKP